MSRPPAARRGGVSTIVLSARVVAHPSARRELLQALARLGGGRPALHGGPRVERLRGRGSVGRLRAGRGVGDPSALEAHLRSDAFGVLLGALELLAQPVRLTVARAADEYGKDALPAIRRLRESGRAGARTPGSRVTAKKRRVGPQGREAKERRR